MMIRTIVDNPLRRSGTQLQTDRDRSYLGQGLLCSRRQAYCGNASGCSCVWLLRVAGHRSDRRGLRTGTGFRNEILAKGVRICKSCSDNFLSSSSIRPEMRSIHVACRDKVIPANTCSGKSRHFSELSNICSVLYNIGILHPFSRSSTRL
jgi:hypothetical protein